MAFRLAPLAALLLVSAPAAATVTIGGGSCATDLDLNAQSTLTACYGRFDGNVLNNSNNATINAALAALGYSGSAVRYDLLPSSSIISGLKGGDPNFPGLLNGTVLVGIHYGNGKGGPTNSTTFYKIDATNLDVIGLNLNASSNAVLFANAALPTPEPATWAMMVAGFGALGATLRRRRVGAVAAA